MRRTKAFERFTDSQRHALDWRRNLVVRANAGSGKTSVLIERIVQILAASLDEPRTPPLRLMQIAALTFTRKAAAEIQDRLRTAFAEMAAAHPEEASIWGTHAGELPAAMIGTIDSFCGRILREFAWSDGADRLTEPDFEPLDDHEHDWLRRQAVERVLNRLSGPPLDAADPEAQVQADAFRWWQAHEGCRKLTDHLVTLLGDVVEPEVVAAAHREVSPPAVRLEAAWARLPAVQQLRAGREQLAASLRALAASILRLPKPNETLTTLRQAIPRALERLSQPGRAAEAEVLAWLRARMFTQAAKPLRRGMDAVAEQAAPLQEAWAPHVDDLHFDLDGESAALEAADRLVRLLSPAHAEYLDLCQQANRFDFLTIARRVREVLRKDRRTRDTLRERYRYVLVDEFQDTNELQWEIISYLVGDGPGGRLDRDRLFVVGDPQQSIYRFRDADVSVFHRVTARILADNRRHGHHLRPTAYDGPGAGRPSTDEERLGLVALRENFRCLPVAPLGILDRVFRHVFDPARHGRELDAYPFEVPYQTLIPGAPAQAVGEVTYAVPPGETGGETDEGETSAEDGPPSEGDLAVSQVRGVADWLVGQHGAVKHTAKPGDAPRLSWHDMAVLLPSRSVVLAPLIKELARRGVPYRVVRGTGFWQRQEVRDVVSLVAWLADAGDPLSLLAILRGPLGQLPDTEILFLSELGLRDLWRGLSLIADAADSPPGGVLGARGGKLRGRRAESLRRALTECWAEFSPAARERLRQTAARLLAWRARADRTPAAELILRALEETGAYALYAAEPDGETVLANLDQAVRVLREEEARSGAGMTALARFLRRRVDRSLHEEQASPAAEDEADAVQVMTVHAAKGLEFPAVAVMKMDRALDRRQASAVRVTRAWDRLLPEDVERLPPCPAGTVTVRIRHPVTPRAPYKPRLWTALERLDRAQQLAESRRIFYVAATRAKERLLFVGKTPSPGPRASVPAESWQAWFEDALGIREAHRSAGRWDDGTEGAHVTIVTQSSAEPVRWHATPPARPGKLRLGRVDESAPFVHVAATGLEEMRQLWRTDPNAWWMQHRCHVLPRVPAAGASDPDVNAWSAAVGTLLHRIFECHGATADRPARERRRLIEAMAARLVEDPGASAEGTSGPNGLRGDRFDELVEATDAVLTRIARGEGRVRRLLEAAGLAEVSFCLRVGRWHISGRFDKVLDTPDGSELVDWKSGGGDCGRLVELYRPQAQLYALALSRLSPGGTPPETVRIHLALLEQGQVEVLRFHRLELEAFAQQLEDELRRMDAFAPDLGTGFATW